MTLVDALFLTAANAIACIILPKFLSSISTANHKQAKSPSENIELRNMDLIKYRTSPLLHIPSP